MQAAEEVLYPSPDAYPDPSMFMDNALHCACAVLRRQSVDAKERRQARGRPSQPRSEDEPYRRKMQSLHAKHPGLTHYELAGMATGRKSRDRMVIRLARWWKRTHPQP